MSEGDIRWQVGTGDLVRAAMSAMVSVRREYGEFLGLVAELNDRGAAVELGYGSAEKMLVDLVRVSRGEARQTVRRAAALHDRTEISGATVPAALPATAAALAEGAVSVEHVDRIREFHDQLPADVDRESWQAAEAALASMSRTNPPRGLCRPIEELRARLDPDGREPREPALARPRRELHLSWHGDRLRFSGELDREAGLLLDAALSPLTAPSPTGGEPDTRGTPARYGDAFADLVAAALRAQQLPGEGGGPVTVLVTMDADQLRDAIGAATTTDGQRIPASQVRRMACDAGVIPTLLGGAGEVLDMGNRSRTAPASVRNRLVVRDRGCAFPGCERPPAHCDSHHVVHWADGGKTTPDNMALLCGQHHRFVHHTEWEIRIAGDGIPEFLPPSYLDPHRAPRRQPRVRTNRFHTTGVRPSRRIRTGATGESARAVCGSSATSTDAASFAR